MTATLPAKPHSIFRQDLARGVDEDEDASRLETCLNVIQSLAKLSTLYNKDELRNDL